MPDAMMPCVAARPRPWLLLTMLVPLAAPLSGCRALAVMFGERPTKTVTAEYPYLKDRTVAILVRADWEILFEHSQAQIEIADHLQLALESNVPGVKVVPSQRLVDYQRRSAEWENEDPALIGKQFGADRLIEIDLTQYTTREPESPHLIRGHIAGVVNVYNVEYPNSKPAYSSEVRTSYPPEGPGGWGTSDREIRRATLEAFAQDVAGRFYDRKVRAD